MQRAKVVHEMNINLDGEPMDLRVGDYVYIVARITNVPYVSGTGLVIFTSRFNEAFLIDEDYLEFDFPCRFPSFNSDEVDGRGMVYEI